MSTHITPNADLRSLIESHKVTVLLVDDQQIIGQAVSKMLAGIPDIDFHYVSDPMQAIASAESLHPTVILLDLVMPEVDGLTLLRYMRAHPTTSQ
ncbi:MAG: response regulator, partial [Chlamydiia bacterium]|nr:response regulator [Chlamydiia bacterium]